MLLARHFDEQTEERYTFRLAGQRKEGARANQNLPERGVLGLYI